MPGAGQIQVLASYTRENQEIHDPAKIAVQGKVVWITPEGVQGNRTQGIGVQFTSDETGASARNKIETILGGTLAAHRPTHTM